MRVSDLIADLEVGDRTMEHLREPKPATVRIVLSAEDHREQMLQYYRSTNAYTYGFPSLQQTQAGAWLGQQLGGFQQQAQSLGHVNTTATPFGNLQI